LGSIAKQLAAKHSSLRSESIGVTLERFYAEWKQRAVLPDASMIGLIADICGSLKLPFVVVDGLDELEVNARNAIVALIKELEKCSIHVLVSGRTYIFQMNLTSWWGNEIEIAAREEDIRAFVAAQVKQNEDLQMVIDGDSQWQAHLISKITTKSAGQ
jgi:rRNA processing protein Gar1